MKNRWFFPYIFKCFLNNTPFGFTAIHKRGLKEATEQKKAAARIPIENSKAEILMLVGKQNNMWNSLDGCEIIMETLQKSRYPFAHKLASGLPKRKRVTAKVAASAPEAASSVFTAVTGSALIGAWSQSTAPATFQASQPTRASKQPKRI